MGKALYADASGWTDGSPSHAGLIRGSSVAIHYPFFIGGQKLYPFRHGYWSTPKVNFIGGGGTSPAGNQALAGPRLVEGVYVESTDHSSSRATMPTPLGSHAYVLSPVTGPLGFAGYDTLKYAFGRSRLTSRLGPGAYPGDPSLQAMSSQYTEYEEIQFTVDSGVGGFLYLADMCLSPDAQYVYIAFVVDTHDTSGGFGPIRYLKVLKIHGPSLTIVGTSSNEFLAELPYAETYRQPEVRCTDNNVIVHTGIRTFAFAQSSLALVNSVHTADYAVFGATKVLTSFMHASGGGVIVTTLGSTNDPFTYTESLQFAQDGSYECGPWVYGVNIDNGLSGASGTIDLSDTSPSGTVVRGGSRVIMDAISVGFGDVLNWTIGTAGSRGTGTRRGGGDSRLYLNGSLIAVAGGGGGVGEQSLTGLSPGADGDGFANTPGAGGAVVGVPGATAGSAGGATAGGAPGDSGGGWGGDGRGGGGGGAGYAAGGSGRHGGSGGSWYDTIGGAKSIIPLSQPTSSQTPSDGLIDFTVYKFGPNPPVFRHPTAVILDENLNTITYKFYTDIDSLTHPTTGQIPTAVTTIPGEALAAIFTIPSGLSFDRWSIPSGALSSYPSPGQIAGMIYGDAFDRGNLHHRIHK